MYISQMDNRSYFKYINTTLYVISPYFILAFKPLFGVNISSPNVITSDVTSLSYVTYIIIKWHEMNKLTIKKNKRS